MSDEKFLMRAIDISRLLGVNDRTIGRWHLQGYIEKKGRAEYCLLSVYKYYRQQLIENIDDVKDRLKINTEGSKAKSLQCQKLESSIKIITANAKIKEYEVESLDHDLVELDDALIAYKQGTEVFKQTLISPIEELAHQIAELQDRNSINTLLENKIESLLREISC